MTFDGVTRSIRNGHVGIREELDLVIDDGELLVLVGPSGCGKSTALRLVAGLETVTDGELRIGDERRERPPAARSATSCMVFQNYALLSAHDARAQNIGFRSSCAGVRTEGRAPPSV